MPTETLNPDEVEPNQLWWEYIEAQLEQAAKKKVASTKAMWVRHKEAYLTNTKDTIFACKQLRAARSGQTTHLTDATTNAIKLCVSKMHEWIMDAWMHLFRMYAVNPQPK